MSDDDWLAEARGEYQSSRTATSTRVHVSNPSNDAVVTPTPSTPGLKSAMSGSLLSSADSLLPMEEEASMSEQSEGEEGGDGMIPVDLDQLEELSDEEGAAEKGRWVGLNESQVIPARQSSVDRRASLLKAPRASAYDSVSHALSTLKTFHSQMDTLLEYAPDFPPEVAEELISIRSRIEKVQDTLEVDLSNRDNRSDVEALLELEKLYWHFNNSSVLNFRARASKVAHDIGAFKSWHMPSFYGVYPIPKVPMVMASVTIPTDSNHKNTGVDIRPSDSVSTFLKKAIDTITKKLRQMQVDDVQLGNENLYVLKAKGYIEYFDPRETDKKMLDHEYIRDCIRNQQKVELLLMERPKPQPASEDEKTSQEEYLSKVQPTKVLSIYEYQNLATQFASMNWMDRMKLPFMPMSAIQKQFRVQLRGLDHIDTEALPRLTPTITSIFVRVLLFHGTTIIRQWEGESPTVKISASPRFCHWIQPPNPTRFINYDQLPRGTRIAFLLIGNKGKLQAINNKDKKKDKEDDVEKTVLLAYAVQNLIDEQGFLASGKRSISLWPLDRTKGAEDKKIQDKREQGYFFVFRATTRSNGTSKDATKLHVRFEEFCRPVVAPVVERYEEPDEKKVGAKFPEKQVRKMIDQKKIDQLRNADLFYELTPQDRDNLWSSRHYQTMHPELLPKLLMCVDWTSKDHRMEAYRLLKIWKKPSGVAALELLGAQFADYHVREYAVNCLRQLPDDELQLYLLQLTQCLKLEPYHDSPLTRFLIQRALANPYQVGHYFFWSLKAELNGLNPDFCERYAVILEEYLSYAGPFAHELRKQNNVIMRLLKVAEHIANLKIHHKYTKAQCMKEYTQQLQKLNVTFFEKMGSFNVTLNPKLQATSLIVEKCRFMSSKKVPLLLLMNNSDQDANPLSVIFKSGDDLRQDILTLQLLRVLDKIWLAAGLDLCMKPYIVMATGINDEGEGVGMIETVTQAETVADIQWDYGGQQASAAFNDEVIDLYLRNKNKGKDYETAVKKFIRSCAGYCVATYLLGIGDRHNDNYMVRNDGTFFHIDFGHFLGNWKFKFGVCRERTKFVFTPEMCHVMGGRKGQGFQEFKKLCLEALSAACAHGRQLETLFALMVSAGMPELVVEEDIYYLRDQLKMNKKGAAEKAFLKELDSALKDKVRRADNYAHLMKHKGKK